MGGITLIALVITIIVLLILAGISIAMLSGDNSILNQAGRARDITGEKSIAERVQIAYLGALANGKGNIERADLLTQLQNEFGEDKVQDSNIANDLSKVTIDGKDYSFDGTVTPGGNPPGGGGSTHTETVNGIEVVVPIPSGFTKSTVTGETSVATGLVVRDGSNNEYVWIPVFEKDSTKCTWGADYTDVRNATEGSSEYYTAIETALKEYTKKEDPVILSGYQFIAGGLIMTFTGFLMGGRLETVTTRGVIDIVYLAFVSAVAYSVWGVLMKHNPVSRISVYGFLTPIFGVILSIILLKEGAGFGLLHLTALVLVCVGIIIVNLDNIDKKHVD